MATLEEIRAKLKAQESRNSDRGPGDNAIYPHWNIPEGSTAVLRFLPDGNEKNTFFWVERLMIRLPFAGVKGDANSKPTVVQVPCMEMYGESCPILQEVRGWFKDPSLEDMGRKYWKKKSYIYQGFVNENPLTDDQEPENPIRRFIISSSIHNIIKDALMDPDIQEIPTDYDNGLDFRIVKATKGQYADYSTSKWARKESSITEAQRAAVEEYGLFDLSSFLPKKPTEVEVEVLKQMFEDSVDGQAYDVEKYGQYFRPYGVDAPSGSTSDTPRPAPKAAPAPAPTSSNDDNDDVPFETEDKPAEPKTAGGKSAQDILAIINARKNK